MNINYHFLADNPGICNKENGWHNVTLGNEEFTLFCENGRILMQSMISGSESFDELKEDYQKGLNIDGNYMISLNALHILTTSYGFNTMDIHMNDGILFAQYSDFIIGNEVSLRLVIFNSLLNSSRFGFYYKN